jgi:hypothetical protein
MFVARDRQAGMTVFDDRPVPIIYRDTSVVADALAFCK